MTMRCLLLLAVPFFAIALIGCGDAPANGMVNGTNANGIKPTGTPSSSVTPQASPTQTADKKEEGMFSFPPPKFTSYTQIKNEYLANPSGPTDFSFVADRLAEVLEQAGYAAPEKFAFFWNDQNEFAVVTAMERIDEAGRPFGPSDRWIDPNTTSPALPQASDADEYVRFLFGGKRVYYRVFAFVVSSKWRPRRLNTTPPDFFAALNWTTKGEEQLGGDEPAVIQSIPFGDKYHCYALLYLFVNHTSLDRPVSVDTPEGSQAVLTRGLEKEIERHLTEADIVFGTH